MKSPKKKAFIKNKKHGITLEIKKYTIFASLFAAVA